MESFIDQEQLKKIIKTALTEVLEERRDLFQEVIEKAIEDLALVHAIEEGEKTAMTKKEEIFKILEGRE